MLKRFGLFAMLGALLGVPDFSEALKQTGSRPRRRLRKFFAQQGRNWHSPSTNAVGHFAFKSGNGLQERQRRMRQRCREYHARNVTCESCKLPEPPKPKAAAPSFIRSLFKKEKQ